MLRALVKVAGFGTYSDSEDEQPAQPPADASKPCQAASGQEPATGGVSDEITQPATILQPSPTPPPLRSQGPIPASTPANAPKYPALATPPASRNLAQTPTQRSILTHDLPPSSTVSPLSRTPAASGRVSSDRHNRKTKSWISYPSPHDGDDDEDFSVAATSLVNDDDDDDDDSDGEWTPAGSRLRSTQGKKPRSLTLNDLRFPSSGTRIQVTDFGASGSDRVTYNPDWRGF
ncbi:hypothetical protein HDU86_001976 [Geranomyces michiganensis]|nr:hypothetical protein HDU86_001976 [Geranomyces michiganensis]